MAIDVNAIEQTVVVTAVGDEVNVNIIDQPVLVSVTDQIIEVEASGGTGPQGPAGAGVAAGGTTGQVLSKASNTNYDTVWVDAGAGTVYSVDASGSTGISVTGGPITGAGVLTITNTLPDQVVSLTGAGTAVITGTYPNFTITTNDEHDGTVTSVNLTAGTGISVSGGPITSSGAINVVNTAPDQVVSLTGGGTTTISGTYPNFTISSADQYSGTVTSVNMTVPTGLTISGNPITSAGTLALALASGYSIPTTASQANWDSAYNDKINSASVTGTSTKTLTLNQQDGGTVTASWSDIDTGLTSVGLTMPSAFSVANSPLTSNGTIAVTGAGTAAQYVRGDGQLATLPSFAGGGSSVNYYLNGSINASVAGYKQLSMNAVIGVGTNFTLTGNGLIAQFLTDAGDPNRVQIPGGAWNFETYFSSSSNGGSEGFYIELLKYNGSTFTLIASSVSSPESITGGTTNDLYVSSIAVPSTTLATTDRLAIRIYIVNNSGARTITLHTEDNNLCQVITTFAGGVASLNGLTANTQYFATGISGTDFNIQSLTDTHTFNLPVASGSNTGKLSNVDWLTFDGKENVLTFSAPLSRSVNTVSIPVANASQPGYLDSADWTTFNAKVTSVSATSPLFSTGGKTPTLTIQQSSGSQNGYLSSTDWTTFNNKQNAITLTTTGASGASTFIGSTLNIPTYTLTGLGGVPTTRQLTINGTAYDLSADRSWTIPVHDAVTIGTANGLSLSTQVLSLGLSSSSANGALSSTDWSTFNGKQSAITLTTTGSSGASTFISNTLNIPTYTLSGLGGVPTTRTLTINGTTYDLSANRTWSVGTVTTAAATTGGQVAFFNGATVITSVSGLYFDGVDKLGIGTASPTYNLDVTGTARMISSSNLQTLYLQNSGTGYGLYNQADSYFQGDVEFQSVTSTLLKVDASHKLIAAVAGTDYQAPITNPVTGTGTTGQVAYFNGTSSISSESNLFWDSANDRLGIGTATPTSILHISKSSSKFRITDTGITDANYNTFTLQASDQNQFSFGVGSTTSNPYALTVFGSTQNISIGGLSDNGNRLQVTGNGYFSGNVGIGVVSPVYKLQVVNSGNTLLQLNGNNTAGTLDTGFTISADDSKNIYLYQRENAATIFGTNNTERMRLDPSGNLGLGVVPSAWVDFKVFQNIGGSLIGEYGQLDLWQNAYYDGSSRYYANGTATRYSMSVGQHRWFNVASGTTGNVITWNQAMTLTASGRLLLGTTTEGTYLLDVNGSARFSETSWITKNQNGVTSINLVNDNLNNAAGQAFRFYYNTSTPLGGIFHQYNATTSAYDLDLKVWSGFSPVTRFFINGSTGAATFSGSVTATRYLVTPDGSNQVYNIVNDAATYAGSYVFQAGGGSAGFGGSIVAYGHSHATKPGWITAGISANSGGKFTVNTQGLGGGTDVFVVQANGNVGIGTTSPAHKLDVAGYIQSADRLYVTNSGNNVQLQALSGGSGNMGIQVRNASGGSSGSFSINSDGGNLLVGTTTDSGQKFQTLGTGYFSGNVSIGTTTPFGTATNRTVFSVNGTTDVVMNVGTGGSQRAYLYASSTYADLGTIGLLPLIFSPNNIEQMRIKSNGIINLSNVPSSATGLSAGDIYKDASGFLKIV